MAKISLNPNKNKISMKELDKLNRDKINQIKKRKKRNKRFLDSQDLKSGLENLVTGLNAT